MEQKKAISKEAKDTKKKVVVEKPNDITTMTSLIRSLWTKPHKNREELIKEVLTKAGSIGKKRNTRLRTITEKNLGTILSGMFGDIDNGRRGWWSECEVKETDDQLVVVDTKFGTAQ